MRRSARCKATGGSESTEVSHGHPEEQAHRRPALSLVMKSGHCPLNGPRWDTGRKKGPADRDVADATARGCLLPPESPENMLVLQVEHQGWGRGLLCPLWAHRPVGHVDPKQITSPQRPGEAQGWRRPHPAGRGGRGDGLGRRAERAEAGPAFP